MSKYVVANTYFSKEPFVNKLVEAGLELVSRLRNDTHLRYLYMGPKENRRGRPRKYNGRVSVRALSEEVFTSCAQADDGSWIAYAAVVNIKAWKRKARVVVVHDLNEQGDVKGHRIYVTTDCRLDGGVVLHMYQCRFQQEFLYRDAKQELGLEHCQAYSWQKIDFHINLALTAGSLAKAAHHPEEPATRVQPFSIADIKTRYVNEYQARRIITMFGIDPDSAIIRLAWPLISKLGLRRA